MNILIDDWQMAKLINKSRCNDCPLEFLKPLCRGQGGE